MLNDLSEIEEYELPDIRRYASMPNATVQERWEMLRQLTIEEYAKMGIDIVKLPMRKDIERVLRLKHR